MQRFFTILADGVERRVTVMAGGLAFDRDGEIMELSPARDEAVEGVSNKLAKNGGVAIVIDYGHARTASGDTLQAVRGHRFAPLLASPGEQDLTSHVDFEALGKAASTAKTTEVVTQGEWLRRLGIGARAVKPAGAGSINYVADWIMDVVDDLVGHLDSDLVVETSIDPALQSAAEKAVLDELAAKGHRLDVGQAALVAMTPEGAVRAMIGGRSYGESQYNRAVAARRQPGGRLFHQLPDDRQAVRSGEECERWFVVDDLGLKHCLLTIGDVGRVGDDHVERAGEPGNDAATHQADSVRDSVSRRIAPCDQQRLVRDLGAVLAERDQAAVGEQAEDVCGLRVVVDVELRQRDSATHRRVSFAGPREPHQDAPRGDPVVL